MPRNVESAPLGFTTPPGTVRLIHGELPKTTIFHVGSNVFGRRWSSRNTAAGAAADTNRRPERSIGIHTALYCLLQVAKSSKNWTRTRKLMNFVPILTVSAIIFTQ